MMRWLAIFALAGTLRADDFARYQIIIDRSPFGAVNAAGLGEAAPGFAARYQFVALVSSNAGQGPVQAIIFDKEANRSYFRAQGESLDAGVTVERIDLEPPKLVLKSGLEKATMTFVPRSAGPQAATAVPGVPGAPPQPNAQPTVMPGQPPTIRRIPFRRGN